MVPRSDRLASRTERLSPSSRVLHTIDHYTSLPWATLVLGLLLLVAILIGAALGFPKEWTTGFAIGTASVTLIFVTVIQHTQGREDTATQRKLDELLRAVPEAESRLIMLEEESDETIQDIEDRQRNLKAD
jgi:low affinity Fe/Cu permease